VDLSPRFRTWARQRKFSLSWRERRDAKVKRLIDRSVRLYSGKVEDIAITIKGTVAALVLRTVKFIELRNIVVAIGPDRPYIRSQTSDNQRQQHGRAATRSARVEGHPMFTAKQYRAKAANSAESLKHTNVPSEIREFQRSRESFTVLAQNEDWLANNLDKIIRSQDIHPIVDDAGKPVAPRPVAETEEHILRCLGAAVIMQWNTIPTKLQRELFDTAGSLGDAPKTVALRGQIARFLHEHKDEESPADRQIQH
jgi:hypothetical protein